MKQGHFAKAKGWTVKGLEDWIVMDMQRLDDRVVNGNGTLEDSKLSGVVLVVVGGLNQI